MSDKGQRCYSVTANFPELPVPRAWQNATGTGGTAVVAISRALGEILKRDGIKGRRITRFRIEVERLADTEE